MRNKSYLSLFLIFGLLLTGVLPWACNKNTHIPVSPSLSLTLTPNSTQTNVSTSTATFTLTNTITNTPTTIFTGTPTNSATKTETNTATNTATNMVTNTFTNTFTPTVTFTPTNTATFVATGGNFTMSSGTTVLQSGTYSFNTVNISGSALVTLGGGVTIFAQSFTLGAGATIRGLGYVENDNGTNQSIDLAFLAANGLPSSYIYNNGPGEGSSNTNSTCGYTTGGGGHGGAGGDGFSEATTPCSYSVANGGPANDDPVHPVYMGSGGGTPDSCIYTGPVALSYYIAPEGWGGGLLWIIVYNPNTNQVAPAVINGTIDMDGFNGCFDCGCAGELGSGGSGGSIMIEASTITGSGLLTANGSPSNAFGGGLLAPGNSGGGIISLIENLTSFSGTTSAFASSNGAVTAYGVSTKAGNGLVTFTAAPSSGY